MAEKAEIKSQPSELLSAISGFKKDTLKEVTQVRQSHREEMLAQIQSFKMSKELKSHGTKDTQGLLMDIKAFKFEELQKVKKGPKNRTGLLTEIRNFQKRSLVKRTDLLEQIRVFEKEGLKNVEVKEDERKKLLDSIRRFEVETLSRKEELLKKIDDVEKE